MKTKKIKLSFYEVGDVLDIDAVEAEHHKTRLDTAKRCVVIGVNELKNGFYSYEVLTNEGKRVRITPDEMKGEKYIGQMDFSMLFG